MPPTGRFFVASLPLSEPNRPLNRAVLDVCPLRRRCRRRPCGAVVQVAAVGQVDRVSIDQAVAGRLDGDVRIDRLRLVFSQLVIGNRHPRARELDVIRTCGRFSHGGELAPVGLRVCPVDLERRGEPAPRLSHACRRCRPRRHSAPAAAWTSFGPALPSTATWSRSRSTASSCTRSDPGGTAKQKNPADPQRVRGVLVILPLGRAASWPCGRGATTAWPRSPAGVLRAMRAFRRAPRPWRSPRRVAPWPRPRRGRRGRARP